MTKPGRRAGRPLADWVEGCIAPALARFGFGEADIVTGWPDIAGPRLAAVTEPVEVRWPKKAAGPDGLRPPATLVLRVEGVFALELQHMAPVLIERINNHLGWRCIGRFVLRQAPVGHRPVAKRPAPPAPAAVASAERLASGIEDEALRLALVRLGAHVLTAG